MKSKLTIVAALVSIACTGMPLQAEETEIMNRKYAIVGVVYTQCDVEKGLLTQEQADDALRDSIKYNPEKRVPLNGQQHHLIAKKPYKL